MSADQVAQELGYHLALTREMKVDVAREKREVLRVSSRAYAGNERTVFMRSFEKFAMYHLALTREMKDHQQFQRTA